MGSTLSDLLYHVIFSTKHRVPIISTALSHELYSYMAGIVNGEGGKMLLVGGAEDHVHGLIKLKPSQTLSTVVQKLKGHSSKWLNKSKKIEGRFSWQSGYAAYSVSRSLFPAVCRYIENQAEHHRKLSFEDEYTKLLQKHGVEFDKRYLRG